MLGLAKESLFWPRAHSPLSPVLTGSLNVLSVVEVREQGREGRAHRRASGVDGTVKRGIVEVEADDVFGREGQGRLRSTSPRGTTALAAHRNCAPAADRSRPPPRAGRSESLALA